MRNIIFLKGILVVIISLVVENTYGQLALGTNIPDINADLTLGSDNKGLLLNNVRLVNENSASPLVLEYMAPGMMVYNITENEDFSEGVYFWTIEKKWARMYTKEKATRDMQFIAFKQTKTQITLTKARGIVPINELDYDYTGSKDGLLFIDNVIYAALNGRTPVASHLFCYTTVTESDTRKEIFKGVTAISPYMVIASNGANATFGLSSFVVPVVKGKKYEIRTKAQETFADTFINGSGKKEAYEIFVGDFIYNGKAHSSIKITFMSEPSL